MFTIEDFILYYFSFQLEKEFCSTDRHLALGQRHSLQASRDGLRDFWASRRSYISSLILCAWAKYQAKV